MDKCHRVPCAERIEKRTLKRKHGTHEFWLRLANYLMLGAFAASYGNAQAATTEMVSLDSEGAQGNSQSLEPSISADGRVVAFSSSASNLVANDTNGTYDIFVRDRVTGFTKRVSVSSEGEEGNNESRYPSISANGHVVAFYSLASNLVAGDTNGRYDVFVHDLETGSTERVSVDSGGTQGDSHSFEPSISADGLHVAFRSRASNLVSGDTNNAFDVFVHDRSSRQTARVSVDSSGAETTPDSFVPALSADGRYVAFWSFANNLVADDTNGQFDVFVHDRNTGQTGRVSVTGTGAQANSDSRDGSISAGGRYVAFRSYANNLVSDDISFEWDVFVHDRDTGLIERVSVDSAGAQGNAHSHESIISADGRYVAFASSASNLVPSDTNGSVDVFIHYRDTGLTERVSVSNTDVQGNGDSRYPSISANGRVVAFASLANNLVDGDDNGDWDVFIVSLFFTTTPPGENVVVQPPVVDQAGDTIEDAPDITFTFEEIEAGGDTTVLVTAPGPGTTSAPSGFRLAGLTGGPVLFDINTTADLAPGSTFEVCFSYSGMKVAGSGAGLTLAHEVGGVWVDITTSNDTVNEVICGIANCFSYFALLESIAVVASTDPAALGTEVFVGMDVGNPSLTDSILWHWGDGSSTNVAVVANEVVTGHFYAEAGVYSIRATVLVDGIEAGAADFQYVVVYDPSAGFVTGGGWFYSPEGAYPADLPLTGRATFGFVSKYKTGAFVPSGNTEFQFKAGGLSFRSMAYEWLVISGARAQYKGTGKINDYGNFGFMLTALDSVLTPSADVDRFRIRIWDRDDGDAVIYDNGLAATDDGDPTTNIEGGSIVIHKASNQ